MQSVYKPIFFRLELSKEKEACMHEKTKLKDQIKKYETEFAKQMGRPLTKEDREYHKEDFERYKVRKILSIH